MVDQWVDPIANKQWEEKASQVLEGKLDKYKN